MFLTIRHITEMLSQVIQQNLKIGENQGPTTVCGFFKYCKSIHFIQLISYLHLPLSYQKLTETLKTWYQIERSKVIDYTLYNFPSSLVLRIAND